MPSCALRRRILKGERTHQAVTQQSARSQQLQAAQGHLHDAETELKTRIAEAGFTETALHTARRSREQRSLDAQIRAWEQTVLQRSTVPSGHVKRRKAWQPLTWMPWSRPTPTQRRRPRRRRTGHRPARHHRKPPAAAKQLADIAREQAEQRARFTVLGRLSNLANGKGSQRITFERFVKRRFWGRSSSAPTSPPHNEQRSLPASTGVQCTGQATHCGTRSGRDGRTHRRGTARLHLSAAKDSRPHRAALGLADIIQAQYGGIQLGRSLWTRASAAWVSKTSMRSSTRCSRCRRAGSWSG